MSTHDFPSNHQTPVNDSTLRERLITEIAHTTPAPPASLPPPAQAAETAEDYPFHPFSDLNVTSFARQVDSLFLFRWLEGLESTKKTPARPLCTRPIPPAVRSNTGAAR